MRTRTVLLAACSLLCGCSAESATTRTSRADTTLVRNALPVDTAALVVVDTMALGAGHDVTSLAAMNNGAVVLGTHGGLVLLATSVGVDTVLTLTRPVRGVAAVGDTIAALTDDARMHVRRPHVTETFTWSTDFDSLPSSSRSLLAGDDGTLITDVQPAVLSGESASVAAIRYTLDGVVLDTLRIPLSAGADCSDTDTDHFASGSWRDVRIRYLPLLVWSTMPDGGIAYACPRTYAYETRTRAGRVTRVTREYDAVPSSADERDSFKRAWTLRMQASRGGGWHWRGDSLPVLRPAFQAIIATAEGRLWLLPSQPTQQTPAPPQWSLIGGPSTLYTESAPVLIDVFARDGALLAVVVGDPQLRPASFHAPTPFVRGDTVWLAQQDNGVSRVFRAVVMHR